MWGGRVATARLLGGRYRLLERLSAGGMSVVWRAYDETLGRPVAVKLLLSARRPADHSSRDRIRAEAQAVARLSHPHITRVHDYGESRIGSGVPVPYVVMELLSGSTLADRLRAGPLPVRTALQVCAQVASALAAAHGSGLVHRDVKPANVMLTPTGAKVLDFGLAAAAGAPEEAASGGQVWGTPAYLAPERLSAGEVVAASDVYALGLLLYATLTGGRPWPAETLPELLHAHRYEQPAALPPIEGLPGGVPELYRRCLAKDAGQRPAAHEAARVLAGAVGWRVSGVVALRSGGVPAGYGGRRRPQRTGIRSRAGRWRAVALAGSAATVVGSVVAGVLVADQPPVLLSPVPGAAGASAAVWTTAPAPETGPANGDAQPGDPPARPGPVDSSGTGPSAGPGQDGGTGGGDPAPGTAPVTGSAGGGAGAGSGSAGGDAPSPAPSPTSSPPGDESPSPPPPSPSPSPPPASEVPPAGDPPDSDAESGTPLASLSPEPVDSPG